MCCVSCIYRGPGCHDISRRQTRHIPHQPVKSSSIFRFPMFRNQNHGSLCPCRFYVIPLACLASRAAYSNKLDYVVYLAEASRSDQQTKQSSGQRPRRRLQMQPQPPRPLPRTFISTVNPLAGLPTPAPPSDQISHRSQLISGRSAFCILHSALCALSAPLRSGPWPAWDRNPVSIGGAELPA